jgi:GxxExxY protein
MPTHVNVLAREIISSAIEVHRKLGPGLLESAYQKCLARELVLLKNTLKIRVASFFGVQRSTAGIRLPNRSCRC